MERKNKAGVLISWVLGENKSLVGFSEVKFVGICSLPFRGFPLFRLGLWGFDIAVLLRAIRTATNRAKVALSHALRIVDLLTLLWGGEEEDGRGGGEGGGGWEGRGEGRGWKKRGGKINQ